MFQQSNETLFYKFAFDNIETVLPILYTPTVGLVCQMYTSMYKYPAGLYITVKDRGNIYKVLQNWPESDVKAIVVTDGERILGLGDLGAQGMGIPVGKLMLYTILGRLNPQYCLPITLDVGTNNQKLLDDPYYIGIREKRIVGEEYNEFIEEFLSAVIRSFSRKTLIQFEDFSTVNAFQILEKYKHDYCVFNDDIQGTASVVLSGLITANKVTTGGHQLSNNTFLFIGSGSANVGIAELLIWTMMSESCSEEQALSKIYLTDSKGLLVKSRSDLSTIKKRFAKDIKPMKDLVKIIKHIKPTMLIGATGAGPLFTPDVIKEMAKLNRRPIIFALSNPTSKSECTAEDAIKYTDGKVLFASGSPFEPVKYKGKTYHTRQSNNAYIFPGIALAATTVQICNFPEELFHLAAKSLSKHVHEHDIQQGSLYPLIKEMHNISLEMATDLSKMAYKIGIAAERPEPPDLKSFIRAHLYQTTYKMSLQVFPWRK
uniref:Malic enzyme n=1 Tax=Clastoptera arizonana TaxID=38151 RepID=A0A1B6EDV3_9HEMI